MSAAVRRRAALLALLVTAWVVALGCFPIFTPEITRKSDELVGTIRDEFHDAPKRLYIIASEEHQGLRRYRLVLTGLMKDRPEPSLIEFDHDEVTGRVAVVRETDEPTKLSQQAHEVRIVHPHDLKRTKENNTRSAQIAAALTNDGTLPTSVFVEPLFFADDYVSLQFHYRDQLDIIRQANLAVIPRSLNQHPGLAALNRLNYVWSVPTDVVVVVVGWAIFWPIGVAFTTSGGFH